MPSCTDQNLSPLPSQHPIVFFDGVCAMCNSFIDFLLQHDRKKQMQFAPLQGSTAIKYLHTIDAKSMNSVIYVKGEKIFIKFNAVIEICNDLGGVWKIIHITKVVPKSIRDYCYDFVAKNRIKWFGSKETCRIPTTAEKGRLLP
jgi:predicted DCC family thiol-disulfide oxidoreductase YuxK